MLAGDNQLKTTRENKAAEYGLVPERSSMYIEDTHSELTKIDESSDIELVISKLK